MKFLEQLLFVVAAVWLIWIYFKKHGNSTIAQNPVTPITSDNASDLGLLPEYVYYNVPNVLPPTAAIPTQAVGQQGYSGTGCSACSLFATSFSSQL